MKNELTAEEAGYLAEFLNPGNHPNSGLADLVRWWDSIPCDARSYDHPQYLQREVVLGSYLNWSHEKTWAWDGMQNLLDELQRRGEQVPRILEVWAYSVARGRLPRPGKKPGRKREWERDVRIYLVLGRLRSLGFTWEQAINEVAGLVFLTFDAVKAIESKFKEEWPIEEQRADSKASLT